MILLRLLLAAVGDVEVVVALCSDPWEEDDASPVGDVEVPGEVECGCVVFSSSVEVCVVLVCREEEDEEDEGDFL